MKFPRTKIRGQKTHRSGWPYAMSKMRTCATNCNWWFEDYVDHTNREYRESWAGVFHHPAGTSGFGKSVNVTLAKCEKSLPHLKLAIALSQNLADELRWRLKCSVIAVKHPTFVPDVKWQPEKFFSRPRMLILQPGCFHRNTELIRQIPGCPASEWERLRIVAGYGRKYIKDVQDYWRVAGRSTVSECRDIRRVSNNKYDALLSESVVVNEMFAASACNVVVECIARNTPVVVNPLPSTVEYLGRDYPLYFRDVAEIPDMLADGDLILAAHDHLRTMDKSWISAAAFAESIGAAIERIQMGGCDHDLPAKKSDAG